MAEGMDTTEIFMTTTVVTGMVVVVTGIVITMVRDVALAIGGERNKKGCKDPTFLQPPRS